MAITTATEETDAQDVQYEQWQTDHKQNDEECPFDNATAAAATAASVLLIMRWFSDGWSTRLYRRYRLSLLLLFEYIAQHYSVYSGLYCHCTSLLVFHDDSGRLSLDQHRTASVVDHYLTLDLLRHSYVPAQSRLTACNACGIAWRSDMELRSVTYHMRSHSVTGERAPP